MIKVTSSPCNHIHLQLTSRSRKIGSFYVFGPFHQPLLPAEATCCGGVERGGEGRLTESWYRCIGGIKQQPCQCSSLQISSDGARISKVCTDFTMTGLTGSSVWFSQILWLNNSVIHILSAFKAPIPSFKSLPFGQGAFFSPIQFRFPFFAVLLVHQPPRPRWLAHPPFSAHLLGLGFPFFPPAPCLAQGPYNQIGLHWRDKCSANALKHIQ